MIDADVFATTKDIATLSRCIKHPSTAREYYDAASGANNAAGTEIEKGNEPYLVNLDAYQMGVHPFIEVYDVMKALDGDNVVLGLNRGNISVPGETLIAWR